MQPRYWNVQDERGNAVPGAQVTIRKTLDQSIASIFDPVSGAALSNPFTVTDSGGEFGWTAADGVYDEITVTRPGVPADVKKGILLRDPGSSVTTLAGNGIFPTNSAAVNQTLMQALVNAVSLVGGGTIVADVGTYNFLGSITPKSGVSLRGKVGKTIFRLDNAAPTNISLFISNATGADGSLDNFTAEGITFDGNGKDAAFAAYGCTNLRFTDCLFQNSGTYGCGLQARPGFTVALPQDGIWFTRCGFVNNGTDSPFFDGVDIKYCTNAHFTDCWASGNLNSGFNVRGEVTFSNCLAIGNARPFSFQATDLVGGNPSYIRMMGCEARGSSAAPALQLQASALNPTYVEVVGFQSIGNGNGVEISGSGQVYGTLTGLDIQGSTAAGFNVTGDFVGSVVVSSSKIQGGAGDGLVTSGKNLILNGVAITGNAGTGYREMAGATNNYVMPNCLIDGNGTDIGTRVGSESRQGFMSVRTKLSMRLFPGQATAMEVQADGGGTYIADLTDGNAASIDRRFHTKGNGAVAGYTQGGTKQLFTFRAAGTAIVNYPDFIASLTGQPVTVQASGTDTNIDLKLNPKGTGVVQYGTFSSNADAPAVGFITIKDSGGTSRKLMVMA